MTQINPTPPATGSGVLFTISFRARSAAPVSALTFIRTEMAAREGVPIPVTPVSGNASTSGPASPALSISKLNSADVRLAWSAASGAANYGLYRGSAPYFAPSDPPYRTRTSLSYDDLGVLGDASTNHYYVVRSACPNNFQSANSNRVAEFEFALAPDAREVPGRSA